MLSLAPAPAWKIGAEQAAVGALSPWAKQLQPCQACPVSVSVHSVTHLNQLF